MKRFLAFTIPVILGACASSGPMSIGKDTYMITKQSAGGMFVNPTTIKAEIIREGAGFCSTQGKEFQLVGSNELGAIPGARMPSSEIQFMCLAASDPALVRTRMRPEAVVIEHR